MKHSPHTFERNPHSGATSFGDFCTQSDKKSLNIFPGDIRSLWFFKNGFQSFAVFAIHDRIISESDTAIKG